jgi:hypothetical protein
MSFTGFGGGVCPAGGKHEPGPNEDYCLPFHNP